jgi:hypothetical protein
MCVGLFGDACTAINVAFSIDVSLSVLEHCRGSKAFFLFLRMGSIIFDVGS